MLGESMKSKTATFRVPLDQRFCLMFGGVTKIVIGWDGKLDVADLMFDVMPLISRDDLATSTVFYYSKSKIFPIGRDISALDALDLGFLQA
jgi:hypothetical protein